MTDHTHVDATVGIIGDTHADTKWTLAALNRVLSHGVKQVHVLGDFGFIWHGAPKEGRELIRLTTTLTDHGAHLYVTGGNHEGYAALDRDHPADTDGYRTITDRITWLPRGWRGQTTAGTHVASLGGANSIDYERRRPPQGGHGGSWWPEEQLTDADLAALGTAPVDVLLAHDAPRSQALHHQLAKTLHHWSKQGLAYSDAGQHMFQRAVEQVQPKLVLSGHYHLHLDTTETFHTAHGDPFDTRSIILNCNGQPDSAGVLHVDRRDMKMVRVARV